MTRAAGTGSHYSFALLRGGEADPSTTIDLPSVTTILGALSKPALVPWAYKQTLAALVDVAKRGVPLDGATAEEMDGIFRELRLRPFDKRDDAAQRGTDVHSYLERLCGGDREEPSNPFEEAVLAWFESVPRYVVACEQPVYSVKYGYAGTTDLIWSDGIDGQVHTLTDLKTGKALYEEAGLQTRAYAVAWQEMGHPVIDRTTAVLAKADGTWEEREYDSPIATFLHLLEIYRWQKGNGHGKH